MKILDKEMKTTSNGWEISFGGVHGCIYKEIKKTEDSEDRYSTEYMEKYVASGFESLEDARSFLEKKFIATIKAFKVAEPFLKFKFEKEENK